MVLSEFSDDIPLVSSSYRPILIIFVRVGSAITGSRASTSYLTIVPLLEFFLLNANLSSS